MSKPFRFFSKMLSAYGFGPAMMASYTPNTEPTSFSRKTYSVWNALTTHHPIDALGLPKAMSKSNTTRAQAIAQRRDFIADVSDQQVLDTLLKNPDRNRNHHTHDGRCGARVTIDLANAAVFHPQREGYDDRVPYVDVHRRVLTCVGPVHSKDKYKLSPVSMSLTSKLKPICKFRRSTVQRLRHLATTVPRESALAGTAPAALKGNYTGKFLVERRKGWLKPRAALCLLAAEVAASVPSPVKVPGAPDRSSMLWWVAAAACVVCLGRV